MRLFLSLSLLVALSLSGCSSGESSYCERAAVHDVVQDVTGSDIVIDDGALVLHAVRSQLLLRDPSGSCTVIEVADVQVGDRLAHDAREIATSYPAQAWPDHILVERGTA